ncbi:MAG: SusD/RagB family nutrient-binding outer membrane lipoprotein, partial [Bacteroidota bacterium]
MKTNKITGILFIAVLMALSSCTKTFEKYAVNPNQPTSVPAYLLLRQVENDVMVFPGRSEDKFGQFTLSTYTYYGTNEYWTGAASLEYGTLRNIVAMEKEANK